MPHKVEITDKTYEDLKEFCSLNDLKIGQFADKLIRDGLMIEMYGDVPFTDYHVKPQREIKEIEVKSTVSEDGTLEQEMVEKAVDEHLNEIVGFKWEGAGGPDILLTRRGLPEMRANNEKIDQDQEKAQYIEAPPIPEDVIERKKALEKEFLENAGIPTKVINKITKRRLK